jgi:hypothetical protein
MKKEIASTNILNGYLRANTRTRENQKSVVDKKTFRPIFLDRLNPRRIEKMIKIKRIQRIALACEDLEGTVAKYKKLFGIVPFNYGIAKGENYHWVAFEMGEGEVTMELLCPYNDTKREGIISKYIDKKGQGLYMMTLRTESTDAAEVVAQMREAGVEPSWGSIGWENPLLNAAGARAASWQEHYISPKETNGVLMTIATIKKKILPEPEVCSDDFAMEIGGGKK